MSSLLRTVSALSIVALLAACGGGAGYPPATSGPATGAKVGQPGAGSSGKATPAQPMPSVAELAADVSRFKGVAGRDVVGLLGDPSYRRRETPAEVWQYFGRGCVLDLFLYDETGIQRVSHVELRSRTAGEGADPHCLSDLLSGKTGQPNS